jgi:hypothetical protein
MLADSVQNASLDCYGLNADCRTAGEHTPDKLKN